MTKLNATGSGLVYSTYLGRNSFDDPASIAIDAYGNAYVKGGTYSTNFPTTPGALQVHCSSPGCGAFVTKLNASGSSLVYSTYLGDASGEDVAVDASGNVYVARYTCSPDFPTTPDAFQPTLGGSNCNITITKLNASGSALAHSTYLGATGNSHLPKIALDASGDAYVAGATNSTDFPTTLGAFQTTSGGTFEDGYVPSDGFVAKLSFGTSGTAPITTATLNGPLGNNGWYLGPVTLTLTGTAGSNPISAISYSVDSGPCQANGSSFQSSSDGTHQLLFYSVDSANRQETPHGQNFRIDTVKPVSHVAALAGTATSPNVSLQWFGTDATTNVPQMPGDDNGDGQINCADITLVKASFGQRTGASPASTPLPTLIMTAWSMFATWPSSPKNSSPEPAAHRAA